MTNTNEIIRLLCETSGLKLDKSSDFDILAQAIHDKTGERLGGNTLRRLVGYKTDRTMPRRSTLDVIAQYLDFPDYACLEMKIGKEADISQFLPVDCLETNRLAPGTKINIEYAPNRRYNLSYIGDSKFRIERVMGSLNLKHGDILTITQMAVGHRLVATNVERGRKSLGSYEAAKEGGLKLIEVLEF